MLCVEGSIYLSRGGSIYLSAVGKAIRNQQTGEVVAFRRKEPPPSNTGGGVGFIPEFCAVLTNLQFWKGMEVRPCDLHSPEVIAEVPCLLKAKVWWMKDDKPDYLDETWFAPKVPNGSKNFAEFVKKFIEHERQQILALAQQDRKAIKTQTSQAGFDHNANQRQVAMDLLAKQYPRLHQAIRTKQDDETKRLALVADTAALAGSLPEAEGLTGNKKFMGYLTAALAKPGRRNPVDLWLVAGWITRRFCLCKYTELSVLYFSDTGYTISADTLRKRADRLGLTSGCLRGPHPKS